MHIVEQFQTTFVGPRQELVRFPSAAVTPLNLPEADAEWLTSIGLPRQAAPFLAFGGKREIDLPLVREFEIPDTAGGSRYRMIGSNGSGDPVVIDMAEQGAISYLDHDAGFKPVFINSSVVALATCLLGYKMFVSACQEKHATDEHRRRQAPECAIDRFTDWLQEADPAAAVFDAFWSIQIVHFIGTSKAD